MNHGYLPGKAIVPCPVCWSSIDRRAGSAHGPTAKYCSPECVRIAGVRRGKARRDQLRAQRPPAPDRTICPRCGVNKKPIRPNGRFRGWCKPCEAEHKVQYNRSDAGRAAVRRYAEAHGLTKTPMTSTCQWCGTGINLRGDRGAGQRRYCDKTCRVKAKAYRYTRKRTGTS